MKPNKIIIVVFGEGGLILAVGAIALAVAIIVGVLIVTALAEPIRYYILKSSSHSTLRGFPHFGFGEHNGGHIFAYGFVLIRDASHQRTNEANHLKRVHSSFGAGPKVLAQFIQPTFRNVCP